MSIRSLSEAVFRLGQISRDASLTNEALLRLLADVTVETLGVDVAALGVYERGIENPSTACCVRGAMTESEQARLHEQSRWDIDDRVLAQRLAGLRRGRLYHRPDLIAEREFRATRLYKDIQRPMNTADQALALFRRSDGAELLLGINTLDGHGRFPRSVLAKAGALAPYVAQCWAAAWRREPTWMAGLKPQARAILEQLLQGYDDDQIAERTGLSYHSVRAHLKRLFREAGVRSRLHLMQAARSPEPQLDVEQLCTTNGTSVHAMAEGVA